MPSIPINSTDWVEIVDEIPSQEATLSVGANLQSLIDLLQLVALNDVALFIVVEVA